MKNGFCFLTDLLPTKIGNCTINTKACTAIAVTIKFQSECDLDEKAFYAVGKLFGKSYYDALNCSGLSADEFEHAIVSYLSGPAEAKTWAELHSPKTADSKPKAKAPYKLPDFDFTQDSDSIISAFRQVYGLSLDETCDLHWWEFLALFRNLPPEGNTFSEVRALRNRKPRPSDSPEAKAELAKAKQAVKLKDTRSPEQKAKDRQTQFDDLEL